MCGFAGVVDWRGLDISCATNRVFEALQTRGPDDRGSVLGSWYQLLHVRLSILDLSWRGHQPMSDHGGRYLTAYNGEIYNFRQINEELAAKGVGHTTESDTETLLSAFSLFGTDAFAKFHGMFSGVIVDRAEKAIYLFRDRLGVKPLYFHRSDERLVFGSTPEVVSELAGGLPIDVDQVSRYLAFRTAGVDASFFRGVEALRPGTVLRIDADGSKQSRFWDARDHLRADRFAGSEEDAIEAIRALLAKAVQKRMVSDVPVGAFLSGGLDSSIVVRCMAMLGNEQVKAHSFTSLSEDTDEVARAARTAAVYGANHNVVNIDFDGYLDDLATLTRMKGAPLTVPNEYAIFKMSQKMKVHNTVVLSGEGADEMFLGYSRIFTAAVAAAADVRNEDAIAAWIFDQYRYLSPSALHSVGFSGQFVRDYRERGIEYIRSIVSELDGGDLLDKLQYFFVRHHLPALLLRLDNATMGASIEGRVPFIDHEVVEFALRIPRGMKLGESSPGVEGKRILYRAFPDLPAWVRETPKIGFKIGDTLPRGQATESILARQGLDADRCYDPASTSVMERWHLVMAGMFADQKGFRLVA